MVINAGYKKWLAINGYKYWLADNGYKFWLANDKDIINLLSKSN